MRKRIGQSTLEYVIVLTAIIAAVVVLVATIGKKDNTGGLGKLMNTSAERITADSAKVADMIK